MRMTVKPTPGGWQWSHRHHDWCPFPLSTHSQLVHWHPQHLKTGRRGTRLYSVIKEKGLPFLTIICVFQRFRGVIEGHQNIWNYPVNIQIALPVSHRYTRLSSATQSHTELLRSFICTTVIQEAARVIQAHFELSTAYLDHSVSQA